MSKNYTTQTAALKATTIDTRILDAKNIFVQPRGTDNQKRENILDIIDKSKTIVYDIRGENVTENDLWGRWIENTEDGKAILHDDFIDINNGLPLSDEVYSIRENKAFNEQGEFLYNIECDKIITCLGGNYPGFSSFEGNLDNLQQSISLFGGTSELEQFTTNLPKLVISIATFIGSGIKKIVSYLPNIIADAMTFADTKNLKTFSVSLDKLHIANGTFYSSGIESFSSHVPYLHDGYCMFRNSNIKNTDASFTNLLRGLGMFENTNLSIDSVRRIAETLPIVNSFTYNEEGDKVFSFEEGVQMSILPPFQEIEGSIDIIFNKEDIGEISISWKDPSIFTEEEKAIIIHEYFGLMNAKGWTVITNLMEGEPDGIYVKTRDSGDFISSIEAFTLMTMSTHENESGEDVILYSAPCVMRPTSGFSGTDWEKYATIEDAEAALNLTPINQ